MGHTKVIFECIGKSNVISPYETLAWKFWNFAALVKSVHIRSIMIDNQFAVSAASNH